MWSLILQIVYFLRFLLTEDSRIPVLHHVCLKLLDSKCLLNSVCLLVVVGLYDVPTQYGSYSADDEFESVNQKEKCHRIVSDQPEIVCSMIYILVFKCKD